MEKFVISKYINLEASNKIPVDFFLRQLYNTIVHVYNRSPFTVPYRNVSVIYESHKILFKKVNIDGQSRTLASSCNKNELYQIEKIKYCKSNRLTKMYHYFCSQNYSKLI